MRFHYRAGWSILFGVEIIIHKPVQFTMGAVVPCLLNFQAPIEAQEAGQHYYGNELTRPSPTLYS
jgi:hypothetical protein